MKENKKNSKPYFIRYMQHLFWCIGTRNISVSFKDNTTQKKRQFLPIKIVLFCFGEIILLIALILIFGNRYLTNNWGSINTEEVLFHLMMPLSGTSNELVWLFVRDCALPTLIIILGINVLIFWKQKKSLILMLDHPQERVTSVLLPVRFLKVWLLPISLVFLLTGIWITSNNFDIKAIYEHMTFDPTYIMEDEVDTLVDHDPYTDDIEVDEQPERVITDFIERNYIDPRTVEIIFPVEKRNLIYIMVESLEVAFLSEELGGTQPVNLIPEITRIWEDPNNISFSHSDGFGGAFALTSGWTMASIVSQTAGIPLKAIPGNATGVGSDFLPSAFTLGDILEENGYTNTFMIGSDAVFAGRDIYFSSHGNYRIFDLIYAQKNGIVPRDYKVFWGFEDEILYRWAKKELLLLAQEDAPFNFTLLTVDTHHPHGYLCNLCVFGLESEYERVIACASRQLFNFVTWIKQQKFFENTTIIIIGDHLTMSVEFSSSLDPAYKRTMPLIFINSVATPIRTTNRQFSLLDMFPSTLAAMGVDIEGDRLGLGANLFSGKPTILELYSYDVVMEELAKSSRFYTLRFWLK